MATMSGSQSTDALCKELVEFCHSDSLSENGLREIIERYGCAPNQSIENYNFIIYACHNELVTEGILRYLLEYFPNAASYSCQNGDGVVTPLQYICSNKNATRGTVQLIIDACPESTDRGDNNGQAPLHFLCINKNLDASIKLDILGLLLERCPEAVRRCNAAGYTPLHNICFNKNVTLDMVQLLIDAYPESLGRATNHGLVPLRTLCSNTSVADSTAVDILGFLLERYPEAARRTENNHGYLPIHIAAGQGSKSVEFCRILIEAYPESETIATSSGVIPLHAACKYGTVDTVQYLLRLYPDSINATNGEGAYPIHCAILGLDQPYKRTNLAVAVEMVQLLLHCDPNVAFQKIHERFPLGMIFKYACNYRNKALKLNAALKILHLLYDAHPEAIEDSEITSYVARRDLLIPREVLTFINTQLAYSRQARGYTVRQMKKRDENGQVPLHRALRNNVTLGSVKLLVKRNPSVILTPDNSGALPLHVACQHYDSTRVVDYLVGLDSETLTAVDREGNTALHLACRGAKYDTIALLLEKYDAVSVSQSNVLNKLPIHLLFESNAIANREDDIKHLETIFQLLRAYPETVMVSEGTKQASISQGGRPSRNGKKRKYCA
jgi:ankyrin repeat protein